MLDAHVIERVGVGDRPILVALSGGGDSTALLHLMADRFGASRLHAGIVDHALRAGSDADARRAQRIAEELGVACSILTLSWDEAAKRSQQTAREARYRVLCGLARTCGAKFIVVGHNRDDQAETVLMRAARGGAWRGLAGMRAISYAPVWPEGRGLVLARPLLKVRRAALRAFLRARGVSWIEDPANVNANFERVVARAALARQEADGFDPMRLASIAERLTPFIAEIDDRAAALIKDAARFQDDAVTITRPDWAGPAAVRERALWLLLTAAGGQAHGPSYVQIQTLDSAMASQQFDSWTLGGVRLRAGDAAIVMTRDKGALAGRADGAKPIAPLPLSPGVETVWDGRVGLVASEPGWSVLLEHGAPVLARGAARAPLAAAAPTWLLEARLQHLLGLD